MLGNLAMNDSSMTQSDAAPAYPARVVVESAVGDRNRLTTGFRLILAIPHLLLVGGPIAVGLSWMWQSDGDLGFGAGGGVLGAVAGVVAVIAWFAILFTGRYPPGLYDFGVGVIRWNTRVEGYILLLYDD